jgi:hypothetical protein
MQSSFAPHIGEELLLEELLVLEPFAVEEDDEMAEELLELELFFLPTWALRKEPSREDEGESVTAAKAARATRRPAMMRVGVLLGVGNGIRRILCRKERAGVNHKARLCQAGGTSRNVRWNQWTRAPIAGSVLPFLARRQKGAIASFTSQIGELR